MPVRAASWQKVQSLWETEPQDGVQLSNPFTLASDSGRRTAIVQYEITATGVGSPTFRLQGRIDSSYGWENLQGAASTTGVWPDIPVLPEMRIRQTDAGATGWTVRIRVAT